MEGSRADRVKKKLPREVLGIFASPEEFLEATEWSAFWYQGVGIVLRFFKLLIALYAIMHDVSSHEIALALIENQREIPLSNPVLAAKITVLRQKIEAERHAREDKYEEMLCAIGTGTANLRGLADQCSVEDFAKAVSMHGKAAVQRLGVHAVPLEKEILEICLEANTRLRLPDKCIQLCVALAPAFS
jgi:hypothetical protein